jgi:hypothetical protein
MRRRRGFTLTEVVTATLIIFMVIAGTVALMVSSTQGIGNSIAANKASSYNAQGLRSIAESLRSAMSVTINEAGDKIDYQLPKLGTVNDTATGEKELIDPLISDGTVRSFTVDWVDKTIRDSVSTKKVCRYIYQTDPEKSSSQYNSKYPVFQLTTIGSAKAVTITVVTREQIGTQYKYVRLKTTALLRNFKA